MESPALTDYPALIHEPSLWQILESLWMRDPHERLTIDEAVQQIENWRGLRVLSNAERASTVSSDTTAQPSDFEGAGSQSSLGEDILDVFQPTSRTVGHFPPPSKLRV